MQDEPRVVSVSRHVEASPERVFAELADAWMFPNWVVGATHIRAVDDGWPANGSRLHHRIGPWPVSVSDTTEVLECDPPRRLRLRARMWPLGEAAVEIEVRADGAGSEVTMSEATARGPSRWLDNPVQRWLLKHRNIESLARLATIAEKRPLPHYER